MQVIHEIAHAPPGYPSLHVWGLMLHIGLAALDVIIISHLASTGLPVKSERRGH